MINPQRRPMPEPEELTSPFWEHADGRALAIQRCSACRAYYHPPMAVCPDCLTSRMVFQPVSGRGTIYAFTITADARQPAFQAMQPYAVVVVELEEQPGLFLLSNMPGTPLDDLRLGAAVTVEFEPLGGGRLLPQFTLAEGGE